MTSPHTEPKSEAQQTKYQSPIDIVASTAIQTSVPELVWNECYHETPEKTIVECGPSGIVLAVEFSNSRDAIVEGGPLSAPYKFQHIHFHWAEKIDCGSEHAIDGNFFDMEMHAVHTKTDCTVAEALDMITAYPMRKTNRNAEAVRHLDDVQTFLNKKSHGKYQLPKPFPLNELMVLFKMNYYYYDGSLTIPPYTSNVKWMIPTAILKVTKAQWKRLRDFAKSNRRELQNLNARPVYFVSSIKSK
ncbi:putative eukaryotic-type carbonic anhydrase [Trypoxylus dichotomus]